jgi:glycosyltransferase involved in cell wall biosynthesis
MSPLLSIVIPSKNRPEEIHSSISNLLQILDHRSDFEIIISDNSDEPYDNLPKHSNVRVIRSSNRFQTAEENLLHALPFALGKYVFPLGDDDIVLAGAMHQLMNFCEQETFDAMTWNCRNVSSDYSPIGWSRVICEDETLVCSYSDFLERIGFWSIPAAISLTVFRGDLINNQLINQVSQLKSKIYSHVVLYALMFSRKNFAFINSDLVAYKTNSYDLNHTETDHWTNYSSVLDLPDRYFWTLGFVEQLQMLVDHGAISKNFLARSIDIGHFGHRPPLLEHSLNIYLEQLERDLLKKSKICFSAEQSNLFLEYLERVEPQMVGICRNLKQVVNDSENSQAALANLYNIKEEYFNSQNSYPYHRFYRARIYNHFIYETPLGWIALPQIATSNEGPVLVPSGLLEMLLGIQFPKVENIFHATTLPKVLEMIKSHIMTNQELNASKKFQHDGINYKSQNQLAKQTLLRKIWKKLPPRLKSYLRRVLR